jgi:hypothetical protein
MGSALFRLCEDPHDEISAQPVKQQSILRDRRDVMTNLEGKVPPIDAVLTRGMVSAFQGWK